MKHVFRQRYLRAQKERTRRGIVSAAQKILPPAVFRGFRTWTGNVVTASQRKGGKP